MAQISRKELKSDEFVSGMDAALEFYLQHQRALLTALVVVVVVAAAGYGYFTWNRNRNQAAAALLAQGLTTLHANIQAPAAATPNTPAPAPGTAYASIEERGKAAAQQFQQVVDQYGSTSAGRLAQYYLGLAQLDAQDPHASQTLQAATHSSDTVAATAAQHALANLDIQEGKLAEAHSLLQKLTQQDSPTLPRAVAMMELAALDRTYNPKEAAQLYKQLQTDYPSTSTAQLAQQELATLKGQ